jgi:hypothetical protein
MSPLRIHLSLVFIEPLSLPGASHSLRGTVPFLDRPMARVLHTEIFLVHSQNPFFPFFLMLGIVARDLSVLGECPTTEPCPRASSVFLPSHHSPVTAPSAAGPQFPSSTSSRAGTDTTELHSAQNLAGLLAELHCVHPFGFLFFL